MIKTPMKTRVSINLKLIVQMKEFKEMSTNLQKELILRAIQSKNKRSKIQNLLYLSLRVLEFSTK